MKKLLIYLSLIIALFAGLYALNRMEQAKEADNVYKKAKLAPETKNQLDDPNYQNIILPEQLKSKIDNKESFFVYFYSPRCGVCQRTTPVLMPIAQKNGIELHQFNLLEFEEGWSTYNIEQTPTLVYYEKGERVNEMIGGVPLEGSLVGYKPEDFEFFFATQK